MLNNLLRASASKRAFSTARILSKDVNHLTVIGGGQMVRYCTPWVMVIFF